MHTYILTAHGCCFHRIVVRQPFCVNVVFSQKEMDDGTGTSVTLPQSMSP